MKNNKFLKIYAIVILVLLLVIFIIPDKVHLKIQTILNKQKITEIETKEVVFENIEIQKEKLLNQNHEYEYQMLDSIGTSTKSLNCKGIVKDNQETGECTLQKTNSYTKETKKETILNFNVTYLDLEYIFKLIKEIEPQIVTYNNTRELIYKTKILELDTDITIYTDIENINQISVCNAYMTYVFKYKSIKD